MKIASLFDSIKVGGGIERVQSELSKGLMDQGFEFIHLLLEDISPRNDYRGLIDELHEEFIPGLGFKKIVSLFRVGRKVARYCHNENIDVIIGQGDFFYMVISIAKLFFGLSSNTIGVVHTTISIRPRYVRSFLVFLLKRLDKIVLISQQEYTTFREQYGFSEKQLVLIYNTIDRKMIERKLQDKLSLEHKDIINNGKITFINIGRLTYQKNQQLLLQAFDMVYKKHENIQLIILGDGELRKELEQYKQSLSSQDNIYFLGNQQNVFPFLRQANCFILSSRFEGFPMVLIETMVVGIPIIATDCPTGPGELLSNNFLVKLDHTIIESLTQKMIDVLEGKLDTDKQIQENTKKLDQFSLETNIRNWIKLFQSL